MRAWSFFSLSDEGVAVDLGGSGYFPQNIESAFMWSCRMNNIPFLPDQNKTDKQTKDKSKEIEDCSYGDEDRYEKNEVDSQDKQEGRNS